MSGRLQVVRTGTGDTGGLPRESPAQGWRHKELAGSKLTGKQWAHSRSPDSGPGARSPLEGAGAVDATQAIGIPGGRNCDHWNSVFSSIRLEEQFLVEQLWGHGAGGEMWVTPLRLVLELNATSGF